MSDIFWRQLKRIVPARWQWVLDHEGFRRYFANTGWLFVGQLVILFLSFLVGAWVARHLGPEKYGALNYALSLAGIFGFLAALGVDNVLARDLVKYPDKRPMLLGTALVVKGIGGGLAFVASMVLAFVMDTTPLVRLLVAVYALSYIFQPFGLLSSFFQAKVEAKYNAKAQIAASIISSILKVAWIFSGLGVVWLITIYMLDAVLNILFLWLIYWGNKESAKGWRFDSKLFKYLLSSGWPLLLSGAASFLLFKIDQVMIGKMLGETQVGLYAAAAKVSEVWYFIPGILCASFFPAIVNAKNVSEDLYRGRLKNFYLLMASLALLIIIFILVFSKLLVLYLFGFEYLASIPVLRIHIFSALGMFMGFAVSQYLLAENREKDVFRGNFLAVAINVALNFWLIPLIGIRGAAIATLVAYSVLPLYVFLVIKIKSHS